MSKAREVAGPSADCKSARDGFDSRPRLQFFWHKQFWFFLGLRIGWWALDRAETPGWRSFWKGLLYPAMQTSRASVWRGKDIARLRKEAARYRAAEERAARYLEDLKAARKQVSALKRKNVKKG